MKKNLTFLALLCFTLMGYAQNTFVPDDNFEQALINLGYDSGALDNQVPTANINTITSLNVSSKNIADLTGIQDFVALKLLYCHSNLLTSLNITTNTVLNILNCSSNLLSSLDVSANTALAELNCNSNLLTSLDISSNTALTDLQCGSNQLSSLNVSANPALTYLDCSSNLITSLIVSANTDLTDLYCGSNQLTSLNVSANIALANFDCGFNNLTSLNVSSNTNLIYLYCNKNQLTNLDLSANTALTYLYCAYNQLASLNVSINTALIYFDCFNNQLTSLNISANTALTHIDCSANLLASLNVKNGNNANILANDFSATNNTGLSCIQVDNVSYSTANWTNIDAGVTFSTSNCALGTENFILFDFQYYPNPVNDFLALKANEPIDDVTVFNLLGQRVLHILPKVNEKIIDMTGLKTDVYFVKVGINNTSKTFKIIKQ